jgi:hypothetical protein
VKTISKNIEEEAEESSWTSSSFVVSSRSGIEQQDWGSTVISGSSSFSFQLLEPRPIEAMQAKPTTSFGPIAFDIITHLKETRVAYAA